jgi:hypothetical protein
MMAPHKCGLLVVGVLALATPVFGVQESAGATPNFAELAPPVVEGPFVRPASGERSEPVWGLKDGIRLGLWPLPGPRGLLRVYAPYLGQPVHRVINFIAVEPIVDGPRGLSELEKSDHDGQAGKWIWPSNTRDAFTTTPWNPPRGEIGVDRRGVQTLSIYFHLEPFNNGARPIIQARFHADRLHEVELFVYAAVGTSPMRSCILTATMGNYARLRRLHLTDEIVEAKQLWPDYTPAGWGFAPHKTFQADRLRKLGETLIVAATGDEPNPVQTDYDARIVKGWRYEGLPATQFWKARRTEGLVARVNGRTTYWASDWPIPGGISYENFELEAPFRDGQAFTFGVTLATPDELGLSPRQDVPIK